MYEYDEYNPKKKDEYEETEQESIDYSADGMEDEPHVDGESIEMEAEVISGEEYTEEISGEQFSEEEGFSEQESVSEATAEEGAEKAEAFAEETAEAEQEYTGPCVREYHYEEKVKKPKRKQSGNGWKKFIAACLVCSIAGGSAIGVSYSAAQSHFGKETGAKTASTSNTESVYREEGKALCCQRFHYHNRRDTVYGAFHCTIRSRGRRQRRDLLFG